MPASLFGALPAAKPSPLLLATAAGIPATAGGAILKLEVAQSSANDTVLSATAGCASSIASGCCGVVFAPAAVGAAAAVGTTLGCSLVAMPGVAGIGAMAFDDAPQLARVVSNKQRSVGFMFSR